MSHGDEADFELRRSQIDAGVQARLNGVDASGLKVTGYKCSTRVGATRFTARSIDDRLGTAAQILALESVNREALDHKVIFVWSTREETGLDGARAAAAQFGPTVKRVHAVDTFVSADSPLETGRFAVIPIGTGAVVRALDNSSVAPPDEIERVVRIAARAGILARRVVCWKKKGDNLGLGERFGMIKFSSRTDLVLPANVEIVVAEGMSVRGGTTVIGRIL